MLWYYKLGITFGYHRLLVFFLNRPGAYAGLRVEVGDWIIYYCTFDPM